MAAYLAVGGIVAALASLLMWWMRWDTGRKLAQMQQTRSVSVAGLRAVAPGTLVQVEGALRCAAPLTSELTRKPSVYYWSSIDDVLDSGPGETDLTTPVLNNKRFAACEIDDGTGTARLDLPQAEIDGLKVLSRSDRNVGSDVQTLLGGSTRYRSETEWILPPDGHVYVLGTVMADGSIGAGQSGRFTVSATSKQEETSSTIETQQWAATWAWVTTVAAVILLGLWYVQRAKT